MASVGIRERLGYVGSRLKKMGSWKSSTDANQPSDCDVVVQFPKGAEQSTIDWLVTAIRKSSTGLAINICKHETTGLTNMLCTCSYQGLVNCYTC